MCDLLFHGRTVVKNQVLRAALQDKISPQNKIHFLGVGGFVKEQHPLFTSNRDFCQHLMLDIILAISFDFKNVFPGKLQLVYDVCS